MVKKAAGGKKASRKRVTFSFEAPYAQRVGIAGDFNEWDVTSHPLKKEKKGIWKTSLLLLPGTYQYRFVVDGEWQNDPACTECVGNPFGTLNCVRRVQ
jgi:1,4-alpha-glucan branching enzyme